MFDELQRQLQSTLNQVLGQSVPSVSQLDLDRVLQQLEKLQETQTKQLQAFQQFQEQQQQLPPPQPIQDPAAHTITTEIGQKLSSLIEGLPFEPFLDDLATVIGQFGLFKVLGVLSNLAILLGIISWGMGIEDRKQERSDQAWSAINTAASVQPDYENVENVEKEEAVEKESERWVRLGSTGDGGRSTSIERLYQDSQSIAGFKAPGSVLKGINLSPKSCLWGLAERWGCHLTADLSGADLRGADLSDAQLNKVKMYYTRLRNGSLQSATLKSADLAFVNADRVSFRGSDLEEATLWSSSLKEAIFEGTNLTKVDLGSAQMDETIFLGTSLATTRGLSAQQLQNSYVCGTEDILGVLMDPDRDCEKLVAVYMERFLMSEEDAKRHIQYWVQSQR